MAWSFDVTTNIPRLSQSGTDTGLAGIATAIAAHETVARSTAYTTSRMVKPPTPNGFWYRCSTAGTSAATAPTYGTTLGGTTTDGTAVFTAFKAPDIQTLGTTNHYYMPDIRVAINGTLTNSNPQQQNFTCWDLIIFAGNFTSGQWATDGVTPRWDGVHFTSVRATASGADGASMALQNGAQFTFIGGEVQTAGGVTFDSGTTPRCYYTRWRNTKEYGAGSARFRSYTTLAIFQDVETYDFAFDLFRMPTVPPSIKARGSEYVYQYVGAAFGGADAKFAASALENPDGTYDFDNFGSGWVELYNCVKSVNLNVVSQNSGAILAKHLVPLYQDIRITAKDTAGNAVENVRFNCTDSPANSPTVTFITAGNLKTWDFRNSFSYETTTDASGIALSSPALQAWYWENSFKKNLRFPLSTAVYQGRAYNYKTMNISVVLGSNTIQDLSAGMVALDTATTVNEATASAITGITLIPEGKTGGTVVISSNKTYQDIWNYYRWWISQYANKTSIDIWTCTGGTLNTQNWSVVVNVGVTLTSSTNITKLQSLNSIAVINSATMPYLFNAGGVLQPTGVLVPSTVLGVLDTYTGAGTINGIYQDNTGARAFVTNLDPESFGVTWNLRYKKVADSTWTIASGTGNNTTILVDPASQYNVEARVAGYTWKSVTFDPAVVLELNMALSYHMADDGTPQYLKAFNSALVDIFEYNDTTMEVEVTNTTGAILQPGFPELYRVVEKVQQDPALVWFWVNPVTTNSTSQKVLIPPTSPLRMYLSMDSDASVKITCPVVYSDTGISADDRVKGNPDGYSIILGSSATADSSLIVSQLIEQLGGDGFNTNTHSLTKIKIKVDKNLTKTQYLGLS